MEFCKEILKLSHYRWIISFSYWSIETALGHILFLIYGVSLIVIMRGTQVRIIVHEPDDWKNGNLFGTIVNDRGGKRLVVELMKPKDCILLSNLIELRPRGLKPSFKPLMQYYSVMVDGLFLDNEGNPMKGGIYGSVTID